MVVTRTTRNRLSNKMLQGFESLHLRHKKQALPSVSEESACFLCVEIGQSNPFGSESLHLRRKKQALPSGSEESACFLCVEIGQSNPFISAGKIR